ncbi:ComE operon protein 1 [Posidoniimonas polymericola]|uniref:ComE operon protein 1 n=1 Tax=Posidoniimonas polymericola TaxID=2528002 RepID=A0A5C5ZEE5_9BACT|nr:helix-hairpin-helix domain-containing protein [Posidoniimonas polymericola]TWT85692.1 ComE operon protein 1 [Posidoniimonas polymericola]
MPKPLLRRLDQLAVAALTFVAMLGFAAWLAVHQQAAPGLIEIDHATPLRYQYLVNVNEATWPELAQLPGIGQVLAQRIVDSRDTEGRYRTADDLMRVNGIGPRKLAQMQRYLLPLAEDDAVAQQ